VNPEHEFIFIAEDIFGSPKPSDADLIDMMDCGDGMEDLAKPEYSTVDQFQELSDMLGENAVCILVTQHEYTNTNDFRQKMKDALMEDMPTVIQTNATRHTDDGILTKNTFWQPN
jgi:hypothetical protein